MSIIPCLTWVRRGKAKSLPDKVQVSEEDLKRIIDEAQDRLDEAEEEDGELGDEEEMENQESATDINEEEDPAIAKARSIQAQMGAGTTRTGKGSGDVTRTVKVKATDDTDDSGECDVKYNMDDYDAERTDFSNPIKGLGNLAVFASNEEDPYVTLKEDDDSDNEDFEIKSTDNLIVVGKAEQEACSVEVHVYNEELSNLYCHHEMLLPTFPLAVEWLDFDMTEEKPGNFVAVSSLDPTIDIWDLDLVDSLEPIATLGSKPKKKKKGEHDGHRDAVLDLSWNTNARHVLASASADNTIGLWDLSQGKMEMCLKKHKDKVQCVQWHPVEEHMLLSGSFDKTAKLFDCRSAETSNKSWSVGGEVERILWNKFSPLNFFVSTDTGHVFYMDSRQNKPLYTISAHTDSVTGLSMSSEVASMLVTTSTDGVVKVWDVANNKPSMVHSRNIKIGQIHCCGASPESPYVFGFGGEKTVKVWDIRESADVFHHFCSDSATPHIPEVEDKGATGDVVSDDDQDDMDVLDATVSMETDGANTASQSQTAKPKKKKKKKKNKKL